MIGTLFQCDPDLRVSGTELYLDPGENRPFAVVSHGHADHIGRHRFFLATPPTAAFLRLRVDRKIEGRELQYFETHREGDREIRLLPAGHVLGSAMIQVRSEAGTLLYTGDFRLRRSRTAEAAVVEPADCLITESTYGDPFWRFPDRSVTEARLLEIVRSIRNRGDTPVILAYSLGKAQEAMAVLAEAGERCVVHPVVAAVSRIYEKFGVALGPWQTWSPQGSLLGTSTSDLRNAAVIIPPHMKRDIRAVPRRKTIALTGWALDPRRSQWTDHALPFSDHADFDELLELIDMARPSVVYTTHGSAPFARELRRRGIAAEFLRRRPQMRLF